MSALDADALEAINKAHCLTVGKFFQMFAGTSSKLTDYKDGTIHLIIHAPEAAPRNKTRYVVRNIAKSWRRWHFPDAVRFVAKVYHRKAPEGIAIEATGRTTDDLASALAAWVRAASNPGPEVLVETMEEVFLYEETDCPARRAIRCPQTPK